MDKLKHIQEVSMSFKLDLTKDKDCIHQYRKFLHKSTLECDQDCDVDDANFCNERICMVCFEKV